MQPENKTEQGEQVWKLLKKIGWPGAGSKTEQERHDRVSKNLKLQAQVYRCKLISLTAY